MRLGVHLVDLDLPGGPPRLGATLTSWGRAADDVGVSVISCMDHVLGLPYLAGPGAPMLEGYTALGFLAGVTERVELQLLVGSVTYRNPGALGKALATLDVLSGGRAIAGLGAGWYEREHRAYGWDFPPLRDRFVMLEETCQILAQLWSADDGPYDGTHFTLAETVCVPQPLHRIPVMIGGVGERKALRLVAQYADACNLFAGGDLGTDFVAGKLKVLAGHCADAGTSYDALLKTILWTADLDLTIDGAAADFVEAMRAMADIGIEEVHVGHHGKDPVRFVHALGDHVIARIQGL